MFVKWPNAQDQWAEASCWASRAGRLPLNTYSKHIKENRTTCSFYKYSDVWQRAQLPVLRIRCWDICAPWVDFQLSGLISICPGGGCGGRGNGLGGTLCVFWERINCCGLPLPLPVLKQPQNHFNHSQDHQTTARTIRNKPRQLEIISMYVFSICSCEYRKLYGMDFKH